MKPDPELVAALTRSVLPHTVAVAATDPTNMPADPDPEETLAVQNAILRRQTEFHAGRAAVRAAISALGLEQRAIPMGADRAPVWPEGITGSISHSVTACVAAVGLGRDWAGIGIDVEEDTPLDPLLVAQICTKAEQIWLGQQPAQERGLMAKLIFSAKEAAYKAQYPLSGRLLDFDTLALRIDRSISRFEAEFQETQGPFAQGTILDGQYAHAAGILVTGVTLGHSEAQSLARL